MSTSSSPNIVLTGFMGTGKSTVGQLLADRLNMHFVDMDDELVAQFGRSIAEVFEDEGEAAFREAEARLCANLAQKTDTVIATGGGALVSQENRTVLETNGTIFCLTAAPSLIWQRLESERDRPLLPGEGEQRRKEIESLMRQRLPVYRSFANQVATDGLTPEQIVERILEQLDAQRELSGMLRLPVEIAGEERYDICIRAGLIDETGTLLRNRGVDPAVVAIVTNPEIAELYAERLEASLSASGYEPIRSILPEGELHKRLENIAPLYDQFARAGMDRSGVIMSLGGGVVGDMAGFAAATYLRGVHFVQVPTSLLSMIDASVGGKTGVDLARGKNLVGAFKQPRLVLIDTEVLSTLSGAEFRAGLAEIVKHGIIADPELFRQLEEEGPPGLEHLIARAVQVKVDIVREDPFERGRRATLNLGHTFGHAIEQVSGYQIRHGEGVALGLVAAAHMAADLELSSPDLPLRIRRTLERLELPTEWSGLDIGAVHAAMSQDKKRRGRTLRFVLPREIGDVILIDDPGEEYVHRALAQVLVG